MVKLFGGAQVLNIGTQSPQKQTVGCQNVMMAEAVLASLGMAITTRDTGGNRGRKLFFCTRSGDVFVRHMRSGMHHGDEDVKS